MAASKSRLLWHQIPATVRAEVARIAGGGRIVAAQNCPGGFSPGLASRLRLEDGRGLFVKAMDGEAWPHEAVTYRAEVTVAAALPEAVPAPRLRPPGSERRFPARGWAVRGGAGPGSHPEDEAPPGRWCAWLAEPSS